MATSASCLLVDAGFEQAARRDLRQQLVRIAFLVESLVEEIFCVTEIELVRERARRSVSSDLVVLDALCCADERRVLDGRVAACVDDLLPLLDQAAHAVARFGRRAADLAA